MLNSSPDMVNIEPVAEKKPTTPKKDSIAEAINKAIRHAKTDAFLLKNICLRDSLKYFKSMNYLYVIHNKKEKRAKYLRTSPFFC